MVRVKRGKTAHKRIKKVLEHNKGFRWGRKSKYKSAKELKRETSENYGRFKLVPPAENLVCLIINSFTN